MSVAAMLAERAAGSYQTSAVTKSSVTIDKCDIKRDACENDQGSEIFQCATYLIDTFQVHVKEPLSGNDISGITALILMLNALFFTIKSCCFHKHTVS